MCCPDCRRPQSASACVDKRYHIDGQTFDPIPWGGGSQYLTYERQTLQSDEPTAVIDPERWRDRSCPGFGVVASQQDPRSDVDCRCVAVV